MKHNTNLIISSQEQEMFMLSDNPELQKVQLQELVQISERTLIELTSPIHYPYDYENYLKDCSMYGTNKTCQDYLPPVTRFARFSYF